MFGVFAAMSMYLSAEGVVRRLAAADAAAAIAQSGPTEGRHGFVRIPPATQDDAAAAETAGRPRVCRLSLLIDSDCLFD